MVTFYSRSTRFTTNHQKGEYVMGTPSYPFECFKKKYLFIIVQSQPHFDDESWLEHLRDFIDVVVEAIYNEPIVRALGRSRSELAFRVFWVLAPQYEPYGRRYCLPSKRDATTDILSSLQNLQTLYALVNKTGSKSSSQLHTSPMH